MTGRKTFRMAAVLLAALVSAGAGAAQATPTPTSADAGSCPLPTFGPGSTYRPRFDPSTFTANVTNPWFPLPPGHTYVYTGTKDRHSAVDVVVPSAQTRVIDQVRTRIVEDRLYLDGTLRERTSDYYAQDACGNVWYFGEDTAELDAHGNVIDTSGSFHAGVDGAQPGVYMQAHPQLDHRFRQEWYAGQAEDTYRAIDLSASVSVPYGMYAHALRTEETTALEPGVVDNKYYVSGIGEVEELAVRGPVEKLVLVSVLS